MEHSEHLGDSYGEGFTGFGDSDLGSICDWCSEGFSEHSNTIIIHRAIPTKDIEDLKKGEEQKFDMAKSNIIYKDLVLRDYSSYDLDEEEAWYSDEAIKTTIEYIIEGTSWHSVDAMRGGNITPETEPESTFIELVGGWNSTLTPTNFSKSINGMKEVQKDSITVYTSTSNVCSIGVTVYVLKKDLDFWKNYFEGNTGYTRDGDTTILA